MDAYTSQAAIKLDDLADKIGGRYRLTYLVAQRLRSVNAGAPLLVERHEGESLLASVCREVEEGKVWLDVPVEQFESEEEEFDLLSFGEDAPTA